MLGQRQSPAGHIICHNIDTCTTSSTLSAIRGAVVLERSPSKEQQLLAPSRLAANLKQHLNGLTCAKHNIWWSLLRWLGKQASCLGPSPCSPIAVHSLYKAIQEMSYLTLEDKAQGKNSHNCKPKCYGRSCGSSIAIVRGGGWRSAV